MAELRPRLRASFGEDGVDAAVQVLTLTELAWHDCYGEIAPPAEVVDAILVVARGDLRRLVGAAHLAVIDARDLFVERDAIQPA
jgi:hypothetical protein